MVKIVIIIFLGYLIGIGLGWKLGSNKQNIEPVKSLMTKKAEMVGFLPYWLLGKADKDYKKYFSTLTYFSLTLNGDGSIQKFTNPGEKEPGWYTLTTGKADGILNDFRNAGGKLSLLVFAGDPEEINNLIDNPVNNANNLIGEIDSIMDEYQFSDLNLDIESTQIASDSSREKYLQFVVEIKKSLAEKGRSLTVEISPTDLIKKRLIDVNQLTKLADKIVVMGYDYHYVGSYVTGPVGPLSGTEDVAELDVQTAVKLMLNIMPAEKIVLGIPVYGYEWETVSDFPRAAVIPGTGVVASDRRIEQLLTNCNECKLEWDEKAKESYIIFLNSETKTYHQIFYPDQRAMKAKADYIKDKELGGGAIWALGYEDNTVLNPLEGAF